MGRKDAGKSNKNWQTAAITNILNEKRTGSEEKIENSHRNAIAAAENYGVRVSISNGMMQNGGLNLVIEISQHRQIVIEKPACA